MVLVCEGYSEAVPFTDPKIPRRRLYLVTIVTCKEQTIQYAKSQLKETEKMN